MARCVFFSFHYDDDILRVGQIRNSGIVLPAGDTARGFIDSASWESVKRQGEGAIKKWIDNELNGTSVTVDPIAGYKFNPAVSTLIHPALVSLDLALSSLSSADRAAGVRSASRREASGDTAR